MSANTPTGAGRAAAPLPPAGFLLLSGLSLFWGLNWPFMKIALSEIPVWPYRSLCLIVGGGALLILTALRRQSLRVPSGQIGPLLVCTLFNVVGWHLLSGYGVSLMPAGRASIIAFTMPVWATLFGQILLGERATGSHWLGLGLGIAGLAVLVGPDIAVMGAAPLGAMSMLGAALSWAMGTVLIKRMAWTVPTGALAGWQLGLGAVPITLGAVLMGEVPNPATISSAALWALSYTLVIPMIFCHWAWFKVVGLFPAVLAAVGTLAIPVVGVLSSGMVLGEPVGARDLIALVLVCAALALVLVPPAMRRGTRQ